MKNPVAKNLYTFNKPKVEVNKKYKKIDKFMKKEMRDG